ncbi:MAG TPA: hypothetical protein VFW50_34420 [Streptosporangiaceae bacterium]|nr:hypothetical protein [Streptosporangiaceae bacterium]
MVDTGPVITPPGQYTHCVDRKDYRDVPGILDSGIPATLEFLLCDYLLGGKLVCLAGGADECGIGIVVGLEAVGAGKSGIDALDNDFSFNVLLAPFQPQDFAAYGPPTVGNIVDPHKVRDDTVKNGPLGWLMDSPSDVKPLPPPVDQTGAPGPPFKKAQPPGTATWPLDGYGVLWKLVGGRVVDANREGDNLHKLWDKPPGDEWPAPPGPPDQWVSLPVLHCECEGSRIFFVCQAMKPFLDLLQGKLPGGGPSPGEACHAVAKWMPWPLNKIVNAVCSIVEDLIAIPIAVALAPAMAAAFAAAWEAAQAFDDLFITGPVAKQIHMGDVVIVKGRWDWDAGHSGHTELHPVKSIQKLMTPPYQLPAEVRPQADLSVLPPRDVDYDPRTVGGIPASVSAQIKITHDRWCQLVGEAPPPPDPRQPGGLSAPQLASLTPQQLAVWTAQNRPENSWTVHPMIDGCAPPDPTGGLH